MMSFITANLATIIISAVILAAVVLIIVKLRHDRKKGKSGCGCGCKDCPSSGCCHKN